MPLERLPGCEFDPTAEDLLIDRLLDLWGELSEAIEGPRDVDLERVRERAAAIVEFVDQAPKQ